MRSPQVLKEFLTVIQIELIQATQSIKFLKAQTQS